jgi:tRNA (cmo5U34)-methyltransferase
MTPSAAETFAAHAPAYTALRRRLVPDYDEFYGTAVDALRLAARPPARVLDLGAGTGLMSAHVLDAFPDARVELFDAAEPMLDEARSTLGERVAAVHVADMAGTLPVGPFDAVVSALAIHHLEHADKRRLFSRIHDALAPGGVFVNAEQVAAPAAWLQDAYTDRWISDCRGLGASESEIGASVLRQAHDRWADTGSQLGWLREAGFATADCLYKRWGFAVYVGYVA